MSTEFRDVIVGLWNSLGLPSPMFTPTGTTVLSVDGFDIALSLAEDGRHILLSAEAGRLSANPVTRAQQVRRILESNLRDIAINRSCVGIDPSDSDPPIVVIRGLAPCDTGKLEQLAATISDVSHLTEAHERELNGHSRPPPSRATLMDTPPDGMMIFGP